MHSDTRFCSIGVVNVQIYHQNPQDVDPLPLPDLWAFDPRTVLEIWHKCQRDIMRDCVAVVLLACLLAHQLARCQHVRSGMCLRHEASGDCRSGVNTSMSLETIVGLLAGWELVVMPGCGIPALLRYRQKSARAVSKRREMH